MVWQLAWIAGIVVSTYVAFRFGPALAPTFGNQAPWNRFAAMLALYVGSSLAVWIVFRLISGAINAVHLSAFDHQLGLLLGLAKGALLCIVMTFFTVTLAPNYRQQIVASRSGRLVANLIVRADTYLPKELHDTVSPFVKQFEQQFQNPAGNPAAAAGQPAALAGQPTQLRAMWDGVTSAAAWTGTGPTTGPAAPGQGAAPGASAGTSWFMPRTQQAGAVPAGYTASPQRPAASVFAAPQGQPFGTPQPAQMQPPVQAPVQQRYPVGAQSLLPGR